jgi:NADP-dependent 3-hydroxy acid dehydrogenase YdfG
MQKTILITGATAGIGEATARRFAAEGSRLILTGRRKERLENLKKELESRYSVHIMILHFDVRNSSEVSTSIASIPKDWQRIDVLVNNAGLAAGLEHFQEGDPDDWERMLDTNVKGLIYMTRAVLPFMIQHKKGHIINIGSTAGKEVYEKGNVYCASKHAVDALTKALRIDLLQHGIKVTSINPGMVDTEFSLVRFHGDQEKAKTPYKGMKPLEGQDVADVIWYVSNLPVHVSINDVVMTATDQANSFYVNRTH